MPEQTKAAVVPIAAPVAAPAANAPAAAADAPIDPLRPNTAVKVERRPRRNAQSETVPGGKYVVDAVFDPETGEPTSGRYVNANGEEIGRFGDDESLPPEPEKKAEDKAPEKKV